MFIAMNRFRVKKGSEDAFEKVWLGFLGVSSAQGPGGGRPYALANAGHDTRLIQDWLGHRAIQHTARYT